MGPLRPCSAVIQKVPRRQAVVALRLQQIEHEPPERLVRAHDERPRRHIDLAPFEPASHRRRVVTLEELLGVTDLERSRTARRTTRRRGARLSTRMPCSRSLRSTISCSPFADAGTMYSRRHAPRRRRHESVVDGHARRRGDALDHDSHRLARSRIHHHVDRADEHVDRRRQRPQREGDAALRPASSRVRSASARSQSASGCRRRSPPRIA